MSDRRDINIPETTRDRIKQCAVELGYLPSLLAGGFLHGKSKLIGTLILSNSYTFLLDCVAGVQEVLAQGDYLPLFMSSYWLNGYARRCDVNHLGQTAALPDLNRLLGYQVEGVLYFSTDPAHTAACLDELARRKIPVVILGGADPSTDDVDVVTGDNQALGELAAEYLLSSGCTSFAFGNVASPFLFDAAVQTSFAERLKKAGYACRMLALDEARPGDLERQLSRIIRPPTGFFTTREEIAALAFRAALSLGWRVPTDVKIVVMGQTATSQFNILPITTVNRNSYAAGQQAAELLIRRINGYDGPSQRILIKPSLEVFPPSEPGFFWRLCPEVSQAADVATPATPPGEEQDMKAPSPEGACLKKAPRKPRKKPS